MHPIQSSVSRRSGFALDPTSSQAVATQAKVTSDNMLLASAQTTAAPTKKRSEFYSSRKEDPAYLRDDPGLACLTSQLNRINAQIRYLDYFKKSVADAEEECKREMAASLAKSLVASSSDKEDDGRSGRSHSSIQSNSFTAPTAYPKTSTNFDQWVKCWDAEVGAEYFYNNATGEASWLDPRYGY